MNKRRIVLKSMSYAAVVAAAGVPLSLLAAVKKIDPKDPQAVALGYTDDSSKVDQKKYPKHERTQACSNCQFYQAAQAEGDIAPCVILANKGVAAKGWCSAWAKKAA